MKPSEGSWCGPERQRGAVSFAQIFIAVLLKAAVVVAVVGLAAQKKAVFGGGQTERVLSVVDRCYHAEARCA